MKSQSSTIIICVVLAGGVLSSAQESPIAVSKASGASVTGAFEGWYDNADGTHSFLVGYLNRNSRQELDIPIGPNNQIEPGGPDIGQPTHFLQGRQYGMFVVTVPRDFSPLQRLTWTIVANGQTTSIPLHLHPDYLVSPFSDFSIMNTPPILRFEEKGPTIQGPIATVEKAIARTTSVSTPLQLSLWATDDEKYTSGSNAPIRNGRSAVTLTWSKYRGIGEVTFDKARVPVEKLQSAGPGFSGKATTTAAFKQPGDYVLHVTANDYSGVGGSGELCCWTTAMVRATVTP